jgi:hypothetical protein
MEVDGCNSRMSHQHIMRRPGTSPNRHDHWGTTSSTFALLAPYLPDHAVVWDPFYGHEACGIRLQEAFPTATVHHFACDAFTTPVPPGTTHIVTNPPFSIKHDCLAWLATLGLPFAVLLPVDVISTLAFQAHPFASDVQMLVSGRRVKFHPNHTEPATTVGPWNGAWLCWGWDLPRDTIFVDSCAHASPASHSDSTSVQSLLTPPAAVTT